MRVLVTGGPNLMDRVRLHVALSRLHATRGPITYLAEGGQRGADWWAATWRKLHGIPGKSFEADWETHGDAAGPIRNAQMIEEVQSDVAVSFPGEKGTRNMRLQARIACLEIVGG